ncbi:MAG: FkbM family methyltransferase [Vicinamibacterales bacterium]
MRLLFIRLLCAYVRTSPWDAVRWRFVSYALRQVRKHGPAIGKARVRTRFGFTMELHLDDWVDQHIYVTGNYEDMTAMAIAALLRPGDVSIDVGANVGFFTLLMATRVGGDGAVWAFEPSPQVRSRLIVNLNLNTARQVTVREEAASNVNGTRVFFGGSQDHSGIASLRPVQNSSGSYEVRTCRLSSAIPKTMMPHLVKIDVEGAEYLALEGMRELLEAHHPDIILEITDAFLTEMASSPAEVHLFLTSLGYRMYRIDWDGLTACPSFEASWPKQFNALFTVRESLPDRLPIR